MYVLHLTKNKFKILIQLLSRLLLQGFIYFHSTVSAFYPFFLIKKLYVWTFRYSVNKTNSAEAVTGSKSSMCNK